MRPKSRHAAATSTTVMLWAMWCLNESISLWPPLLPSPIPLGQKEPSFYLCDVYIVFVFDSSIIKGWSWVFVLLIIPCNFKSAFWQVSWDANDLKSPPFSNSGPSWATVVGNTQYVFILYSKWGMNLKPRV
jgi:hypothetical protein